MTLVSLYLLKWPASLLFCVLVTWFDLQSPEQQNLCGGEIPSTLWLNGHGHQVYVVREEQQHLETSLQPLPRIGTVDQQVLPSKVLLGTRPAAITQRVPPHETMQEVRPLHYSPGLASMDITLGHVVDVALQKSSTLYSYAQATSSIISGWSGTKY